MRLLNSAMLALLFFSSAASAQQAEFDGTTGMLTIPEVIVDGKRYTNAKLRLEDAVNLVFRVIAIEEAPEGCSEANINFTRYASIPGFYTVTTQAEMDVLIGCASTATTEGTSRILQWHLPSSTESCPRYIEVVLVPENSSSANLMTSGQSIVGINSETNLPRSCEV